MKFEEFLMRPSEGQLKRVALEKEVEELQERLDGELKLKSVLKWAMKGPVLSFHCLPPQLPSRVRVLLTELAVAEEQIMWLERKVRKLKLSVNHHDGRRQIGQILDDDDRRRRSSHGKHHINHSLDFNLMSRRTHGTPRFNSANLLSTPWRSNAYLCGN
ncbi:hypothetical protein V2J09_023380 [Rumex salicifolius]